MDRKQRREAMTKWRANESNRKKELERNKAYRRRNPELIRKINKAWKTKNMGRVKELDWKAHLKRTYGLSVEDYSRLLSSQGGHCAICGNDSPGRGKAHFSVDHDSSHCDGKRGCPECVRGLLCVSCNAGLGCFRDNLGSLEAALSYLKEWGGRM